MAPLENPGRTAPIALSIRAVQGSRAATPTPINARSWSERARSPCTAGNSPRRLLDSSSGLMAWGRARLTRRHASRVQDVGPDRPRFILVGRDLQLHHERPLF